MHKYPALHNAMWPGLVGKGPDSEPPIELDTMLDLTAATAVDGVKFDGVDLFLFDPHISIDSTDDDLKRLADKIARARSWSSARWSRRSGRRPAAARRWASEEERKTVPDAGAQGLRDRPQAARARHPPVRRRPHRLGREPGATGRRTRPATRRRSPRPSARPPTSPKSIGERLAAEGEICWGGMHSWQAQWSSCSSWSDRPKTRRLPGRHGAHAALHAGLQRAGGSASCPRTSTGPTGRRSTTALQEDDAARCGRGRSTSTSRRTTPRSTAPARTTRPAATACRSTPTASSTSSSTPASGCATTAATPTRAVRAHLLGRLHVPERGDDAAADLERHPAA